MPVRRGGRALREPNLRYAPMAGAQQFPEKNFGARVQSAIRSRAKRALSISIRRGGAVFILLFCLFASVSHAKTVMCSAVMAGRFRSAIPHRG